MIFTPALPAYILYPLLFLIVAATVYSFIRASRQGRKAVMKVVLRTLSVALICLAAFRPAIPTVAEIEKLGTNLDIYFVLDTTASMGAEDISGAPEPVSRLDAAKTQIEAIAEKNLGAKYSLLTFDTTAKVEIPLVRDLSALNSTLDIITPQLYIEGVSKGTDTLMVAPVLEETLRKAVENSPERLRVVYYITDGENTTQETQEDYDLTGVADLADETYVIGVGREEGSEIPLYTFDETFTNIVQAGTYDGTSAMDPAQIERIAEMLGTEAVFITSVEDSFPPVKAETEEEKLKIVDRKSPAQFEFYWVLIIAAGLLLIVDMNSLFSQTYKLLHRRIY